MATEARLKQAVDSRLPRAIEKAAEHAARGDLAVGARYDGRAQCLVVLLKSGVEVRIPIRQIEGLADAPATKVKHVKVEGRGHALHWPALDLDLSVPNLIAGCFGTRAWMSVLARQAGAVKSSAKAEAARRNGRKGGRPRKAEAVSS